MLLLFFYDSRFENFSEFFIRNFPKEKKTIYASQKLWSSLMPESSLHDLNFLVQDVFGIGTSLIFFFEILKHAILTDIYNAL